MRGLGVKYEGTRQQAGGRHGFFPSKKEGSAVREIDKLTYLFLIGVGATDVITDTQGMSAISRYSPLKNNYNLRVLFLIFLHNFFSE